MTENKRCAWCGDDPLYQQYHDREWGVPCRDDQMLFEFVVLEGAQAGLSWITILRKRESYRLHAGGWWWAATGERRRQAGRVSAPNSETTVPPSQPPPTLERQHTQSTFSHLYSRNQKIVCKLRRARLLPKHVENGLATV